MVQFGKELHANVHEGKRPRMLEHLRHDTRDVYSSFISQAESLAAFRMYTCIRSGANVAADAMPRSSTPCHEKTPLTIRKGRSASRNFVCTATALSIM